MNTGSVQDRLLAEQRAYYSALAPDYLDQGLDLPGGAEVTDALDAFRPAGSVLELACGPGVWTRQLLRHASDVTAVDASKEMLAIAARSVPGGAPVSASDTVTPVASSMPLRAWTASALGSSKSLVPSSSPNTGSASTAVSTNPMA